MHYLFASNYSFEPFAYLAKFLDHGCNPMSNLTIPDLAKISPQLTTSLASFLVHCNPMSGVATRPVPPPSGHSMSFMKLSMITLASALGPLLIRRACINIHQFVLNIQDYVSSVLDASALRPVLTPQTQRTKFSEMKITTMRSKTDHTHGSSAAERSSASLMAHHFVTSLGLTPFFSQMSRSDQRRGDPGNRTFYWSKDLTAVPNNKKPTSKNGIIIIDVDYYMDMNMFLTEHFQPVILYTLQPSNAGRNSGDYSFSFKRDGSVNYKVSGGGHYHHKLWNWNVDTVTAVRYSLFNPWFPEVVSVYLVDRRPIGNDHVLVSLTPVRQWRETSTATLALYRLEHQLLERFQPVKNDFAVFDIQSKSGRAYSICRVDSTQSVEISHSSMDALTSIGKWSKVKITLPQILSFIEEEENDSLTLRRTKAAILLDYFRSEITHRGEMVFPVEVAVRPYTFNLMSYDPEDKPVLTPFMSPLINECFCPTRNISCEEIAVKGRVTEIAHTKPLPVTDFQRAAMHEFALLLFPEQSMLVPTEYDAVYEKQSRPTQVAILNASMLELPPKQRINKTFMKAEAYTTTKEPRIISTVNGCDKRDYSTFIYAVSAHCKTVDWYAFGKTPSEIATRVAAIASSSRDVALTDYSRWDGRKSSVYREFEEILMARAFGSLYMDELTELMRSQYHNKGIGRLGTKFKTLWTQSSGSPDTSTFNTIDNAFTSYLAFRSTKAPNGLFTSPLDAYAKLGIYGGDDGITPEISGEALEHASKSCGAKLTCDIRKRGELVEFLARKYSPNVWYEDPSSCIDFSRQMSKFHATARLPDGVSPEDKLVEKAEAFILSDANTPVIGPLCAKVIALAPGRKRKKKMLKIWNSDISAANHYPNENAGNWMHAEIVSNCPDFCHETFNHWLDNVKTLQDCLSPPLCTPTRAINPKRNVVVDNDFHEITTTEETRKEPQPKRKRGRKKPTVSE